MKAFWALVGVLFLAALGIVLWPARSGSGVAAPTPPASATDSAPRSQPGTEPAIADPAPDPAANSANAPSATALSDVPGPSAAPAPAPADAPTTRGGASAQTAVAAAAGAEGTSGDVLKDLKALPLEGLPSSALGGPSGNTETIDPATPVDGELVSIPDDPKFPADKLSPSRIVRRADGSFVADNRFVIRGSGTAADPYRASWDLLLSAQDTFKPRVGQNRIPQRLLFLHGKHLRLTGFVAFPITSNNPREALVMLNQWDGCCIGVPPTAYDAIEVRLTSPATPEERLSISHGTVQGVFLIDPYVDSGWLLGLYLMNDAKLAADH